MLKSSHLLPVLFCAFIVGSEAKERPNVILIYGDDVGWGDVGCYGAKKIPTPHIDQLAAEGLRFTDAHCASSTCTPSRYSLLTGELPFRKQGTGIASGTANLIISPDQYTLADLFKQAGYATAVIGKWHLGLDDEPIDWNGEIKPGPEALGFDRHFIIPATNDRLPTVYMENSRIVGLDPKDPITVVRGNYRKPIPDSVPGTSYPIAKLNPEAVTAYPGDASHSGTVINGLGRIGKMKGGKTALFKDEDIADDLVREASQFIRSNADQPFFLFFSASDIHAPRWPHSRFRGKSQHGLRGDAMVSFDWCTGALMELLDELKLADNTLVLLTSDNGPVYIDGGYQDGCEVIQSKAEVDRGHDGSGPWRGGKYQIHEGGTRMPFIVRWPGQVKPGVSDALFTQTDLLASFATLLQQDLPTGQARDSRSEIDALLGKSGEGADFIIQSSFKKNAIRKSHWKYIAEPPQLYELSSDPAESRNQIEAKPELAAQLKSRLEQAVARPLRAARPNLVFILADDMGFSDLGCYGGEIQTPTLDQLAAQGLRFTRYYNTGRCWPSRAALLTGYHAQAVNRDKIPGHGGVGKRPEWARLLPEHLKPAGYRSYHSGKWHIDGKVLENGFDRSFNFDKQDNFFHIRRPIIDDQEAAAMGLEDDSFHTTTAIAEHAIECLAKHQQEHAGQPFFHYIAFTAPHFPLHALPKDIAKYRDRYLRGWDQLRLERHAKLKQLDLIDTELSAVERKLGPPYHFADAYPILGPSELRYPRQWDQLNDQQRRFQATKMAIHAAMIDHMDREIGRIVDQLRTMDALENTVLFFASDNGASAEIMVRGEGHDPEAPMGSAATYLCLGPGFSSASNTPFRRHKTWVHEGGIATPFLVHWPAGIQARGELRHSPGHFIDFVPTALELAGLEPPTQWQGKALPETLGRSMVPAFEADLTEAHRGLWWLHDGHRAIQQGDWKLVAAKGGPWELYDLERDRAEQHNLASQHPQKVNALAAAWQDQLDRHAKTAR